MSEITPTVTITTENGPVVINKEDFNTEVHILHVEPDNSFDREAAKAFLTEKGIKFAKNIKEDKLKELVEDAKKVISYEVKEQDEKFIIVDDAGNQIGNDFYATVEDANVMLELMTGK